MAPYARLCLRFIILPPSMLPRTSRGPNHPLKGKWKGKCFLQGRAPPFIRLLVMSGAKLSLCKRSLVARAIRQWNGKCFFAGPRAVFHKTSC